MSSKNVGLNVMDWSRSRTVELDDTPMDLTIAEVEEEIKEALNLDNDTTYSILYNGEKLNRDLTLEELGVEDGSEFTIAPEVSAG